MPLSWREPLWLMLLRFAVLSRLLSGEAFVHALQIPFPSPADEAGTLSRSSPSLPWNARAGEDATGNLVFHSLASLLQLMPNSQHPNGHTIVRATIPKDTLLYHGTFTSGCPSMDWASLDLDHAMMFAFGINGSLLTYRTTRDIQLVYFDGCSANKHAGVVDTQDLLIWGEPGRRGHNEDLEHQVAEDMCRLVDGCAWAKDHGVDGFFRMEFDFEIIYCDFQQGLELVSYMPTVNLLSDLDPANPSVPLPQLPPQGPRVPPSQCASKATFHGHAQPGFIGERRWVTAQATLDGLPISYPGGWKGVFPDTELEAFHAGMWHNQFPGEFRIRIDPSSMISLFDPSLISLVEARRSMTRDEYSAANLSQADIARVRADIANVMAREPGAGSGVDWQTLARAIQDRFGDRLPYMQHLLHQPVYNVTAQLAKVRKQLIVSLIPSMHRENVGAPEWFADTAHRCATRFTEHLPREGFTKQEWVLFHAVEEVLHEVCRVYTEAWVEAFDAEAKPVVVIQALLKKWKGEFDALVEWLDWPVWIKCDPACGVDEVCWVPQGQPLTPPELGHTPRCVTIEFGGGFL
ncbi:hypothetical protein C8Q72DRAFT_882636 [Fomitopsis betulina]|nr:hypothetical protein C8Q72DRAFT_882636 [Fomitopsis betulina]